MKYLNQVIDDFFKENAYGKRSAIVKYVTNYSENKDIIDHYNRVIKTIAKTSVYDNMRNVYSYGVIEKWGKGRPKVYFFKPENESIVKPVLLKMDKRPDIVLNYAKQLVVNNVLIRDYTDLLMTAFEKSGMNNFREYLLNVQNNFDSLKDVIWNHYLKKKF